jgi:SpoVK/Ycf46/Vps4 family AAA+-type ATPase
VKAKLRGIETWLRHRHVVFDDWGFAERVSVGRGMAAMFCGSSGTGKTMAAGILAHTLDLDLYRIDLSAVVSKYIGETEKNLARIFDAAEAANAILFFDEADALFGKRSEVKDAHDRHANVEVSYLLQRMESYDGIAILATNLRNNLDVAFARRLQMIVEFPFPSVADRERIWRRLFTERVPQAPDVDLAYLAKQFGLAGGNVKNCAVAAALAAASEGKPVSMRHLVQAIAREYEKIGKPVVPSLFEPYGGGG